MRMTGNEALAAKLNGASREEAIVLARENGIALTDADFEAPRNGEIGDDELDVVVGGKGSDYGDSSFTPTTVDCRTCACYFSGMGHGTAGPCRCIGHGTGNLPTLDLDE